MDAALHARATISQPGLACAMAVRMLGHWLAMVLTSNATASTATRMPAIRSA